METLGRFFQNEAFPDEGIRVDLPRDSLSLGVDGIEVIPHIQLKAGGVADAISVAIGQVDGAFLVVLGDMLILENHVGPKEAGPENASGASKKLVSMFEETGWPCVGVCPVHESEVSNYGVVELCDGSVVSISEKPAQSESLSNYVLCGRYLLPENTSSILERFPVSEYGEMQSIFLLNHLIENGGLNAVKLDEMEMYDSGDPFSWLKSQIDHGLRRDDISEGLLEWLSNRLSRI
jgi:UTP-glucose-1-phosphate uridylyltransferase